MNNSGSVRIKISVNGIVQGVGFRPFVFKLAQKYFLSGFVTNTTDGVLIEIEGKDEAVKNFLKDLESNPPPLSDIKNISSEQIEPINSNEFKIETSQSNLGNKTFISPDVAICPDCLNDISDKKNRRYLYPFTNCTNCGPRFTIIENIPYDRRYTTMNKFEMCAECRTEYENPLDRRFHAQPNACPVCGPKVWFDDLENSAILDQNEAFDKAAEYLADGKIVAIKGLGGFHLAVDATNEQAVNRLRERKGREAKPLAIMLPNINSVKNVADVDLLDEKLLSSNESPIILLKKKDKIAIAESVAPNNKRIGVMLPYTPLHYVLFDKYKSRIGNGKIPALVMTSANLSEEPIAITNEDAKERLKNIADGFLMHDRDILIRSDDSVVIRINNKVRMFRRSRGYVPKAIPLLKSNPSILGLGAELKNTICISKDDNAFLSQHIGDLTNLRAHNFFKENIVHLQKILDTNYDCIAYDMHPDYLSTKWALEQNFKNSIPVQHHHAHMASCMAEYKLNENVIGIILDGTGLGYDNTIWGGEILIGDYTGLERFANLESIPLPGGDAAAKEPWRLAVSYLHHAFDGDVPELASLKNYPIESIKQMLDKKINSPFTSSAGRLFDAVSAMAGGPPKIKYEAEAAIALMQAVESMREEPFEYDQIDDEKSIIPLKKLIKSVYSAISEGASFPNIAGRFHITLSQSLTKAAISAREYSTINKIVLSGGVFQNEILTKLLEDQLTQNGFEVFTHSVIPPNDGGISLGQVAVASQLINNNLKSVLYKSYSQHVDYLGDGY